MKEALTALVASRKFVLAIAGIIGVVVILLLAPGTPAERLAAVGSVVVLLREVIAAIGLEDAASKTANPMPVVVDDSDVRKGLQ